MTISTLQEIVDKQDIYELKKLTTLTVDELQTIDMDNNKILFIINNIEPHQLHDISSKEFFFYSVCTLDNPDLVFKFSSPEFDQKFYLDAYRIFIERGHPILINSILEILSIYTDISYNNLLQKLRSFTMFQSRPDIWLSAMGLTYRNTENDYPLDDGYDGYDSP